VRDFDVPAGLPGIFEAGFDRQLAYMSIWLLTKTSGNMTRQKIKRNRVYRVCGVVMAVSVIGIPIDGIGEIHDAIGFLKPTLIFETIALVSFGISWLVKGELVLKDKGAGRGGAGNQTGGFAIR